MSLDKLFAGTDELHVGKRIGKGGEGEVYALTNLPGYALKAYLPTVVASREAKIRAMVDANLHSSINTVAFPTQVVADRKGVFVGFLMRLVAEHKEIHELQTPSSRLRHFPSADYRFLVRTAVNVARVFGQVHAAGCVIGDINQRSILVSQQATVALIDTDSFQVVQKGQQYLCVVGVPEYTPPELQGQSLKSVVRTDDHDAFGLAVAIFQILCMDRHPFSGRFKGAGDMGIEQAIREFRFAYSMRDTKMQPPPSTVQIADLSSKVRQNFELAFSPQGVGSRPTSSQWISALEELEQSLRPCPNNKAHHYSRVAADCPWCRMEQAFGVPMFISHDANAHHVPKGSISDGIGFSFNVIAIEAILNSMTVPTQIKVAIPSPNVSYSASAEALASASKNAWDGRLRKVFAVVWGTAAIFMFAAGFTPIFPLISVGIALYLGFRSDSTESGFLQNYKSAAEKVRGRVQHLQSNSPVEAVQATRAAILEKIDEYKALVSDFKNIESDYNASRRQQQSDAHLSAHSIRGARISKLTSGDIASLASYGFTTACDASRREVQDAHGIGPVKSANIMAWVSQVERKFHFRPEYTAADKAALQTKRDNIVSRQQGCADILLKLVEQLKHQHKQLSDWLAGHDVQLQQFVEEMNQAEADLRHLKIAAPALQPVPLYQPTQPSARRSTSYSSTAGTTRTSFGANQSSSRTGTSIRSCPVCGSGMRLRTARRGKRAGRQFWGCSRYPTCQGTRNI
jgi:DNA-binding helix-hairpin-helix protein with protein kinase domain